MAEALRPGLQTRVSELYQDASSSSDENTSDNVFSRSHARHRHSIHPLSPSVMTATSGALITTASDSSRRPSMTSVPCQPVTPSRRHSVAVTASMSSQAAAGGSADDREWRRRLDEQMMALQVSVRCLEEEHRKALERYQATDNKETPVWSFSVTVAVAATVTCAGLVGYCLGISTRMM